MGSVLYVAEVVARVGSLQKAPRPYFLVEHFDTVEGVRCRVIGGRYESLNEAEQYGQGLLDGQAQRKGFEHGA